MIQEHALEVDGEITCEDLEYMIKKANRLGKSDREITHVYMLTNEMHKHIYFEVESLKNSHYENMNGS